MMKTQIGKKLCLAALMSVILGTSVEAGESFEFDDAVLKGLGFDSVDLSAFAGSNDQFAGEYLVDIELNKERVARDHSVNFYNMDGESHLCFTDDLVETLAIKKQYVSGLKTESHEVDEGKCYPIQSMDSLISIDFNPNAQVVAITIPQKYLGDLDPNWVKPSDRDHGIDGVILDYNILWEHSRNKYNDRKISRTGLRSYGATGFNLDQFRFRANYQYDNKSNGKFKWTQIYGFTDLSALNSKIYAGEIYSRSELFENTRIKGVSLYSDEKMMPAYLQGYAPQVTGIANSNAIVVVKQYGNILKTAQVPAGPFVISDLPSYINGKIDVEIEEEDGSVRRYQLEVATVPFLTRKGGFRYYANIGKIDSFYDNSNLDSKLVSADGSYGLTSNISVFGGVQFTTNHQYKAYNLGFGFNMGEFGAFSFDVTKSKTSAIRTEAGKEYSGHSYRFNYAKRFSTDTTINIAGYRFSSREFVSLTNYLNFARGGSAAQNSFLEKNRISLSISQYVPEWGISFTGSLSKGTYWNARGNSHYNLSASKMIRSGALRDVSFSVSISQDNGRYLGGKDRQLGFFVTIPLDEGRERSLQYSGAYGSFEKRFDHQVTYNSKISDGHYSLGARTNHKRDLSGSIDYGLTASLDGETGYGRYTVFADHSDQRTGIRAGYDGSLTITQHGIATHKSVYNDGSRLILDAGAPGVSMGKGVKSNTFGLMGVGNVTPYRYNAYAIDNDDLPDNVEIQDGVVQLAVSDGAIAYRSLNGISGEKAIATIQLADGTYPPFGAMVYRKNGEEREIAIVAGDGLTYLTGLNKNAEYVVRWNGSECQLNVGDLEPNNLNNLICN